MKRRAVRVLGIATAAAGLAASLAAQDFPLEPRGDTLTLPNYFMTSIGQTGGLQGGAYVARANDASSNWYNPAGLALAQKAQISSSAGTYQLLSLVPEDLTSDDTGGSSQQVPALVGVVLKNLFGNEQLTGGFSIVRTNSFDQVTDARIDGLPARPARLLGRLFVSPHRSRSRARLHLFEPLALRSHDRQHDHEPARGRFDLRRADPE